MNFRSTFMALLAGFALSVNASAAPIDVQVFASAAPNAFGSPSWSGYRANAIAGIDNYGASTGTAGQPTYYESGGPFTAGDFVVSSFNSWKGEVNPAAPYNNEYGTRMHFGLRAESTVTTFSLSQLNYDMDSSDGNYLNNDGAFGAGDVYNADRVGIWYGADGVRGGGDDVMYNNGESATNMVNLLLYRGIGNAYWPTNPEDMQGVLDWINANGGNPGPYTATTRYWFSESGRILGEGQASAVVGNVPEPTALVLFGLGLIGAARMRRRK